MISPPSEIKKPSDIYQKPLTKIQPLPPEKLNALTISDISSNPFFTTTTASLQQSNITIQRYPAIASQGSNLLVLAESTTNTSLPQQLIATASTDNGTNWTSSMTLSHFQASFVSPSIDYTGDKDMEAFGTCMIDQQTGIQMIFCFPSLTDSTATYFGESIGFSRSGWFSGRLLTWDPFYWLALKDTASAGYPHGTISGPYEDFHGLAMWGGHDGTDWSGYFYCDTDQYTENDFKILWNNYLNGTLQSVDIDIDLSTGWSYSLCEIINKTTLYHEIHLDMLFLEPGNQEWFNNDSNYGPDWVFRNYSQPSIKANNGRVYLACIKDNDVYLHISRNRGYTYQTIQLTNTSDIETAPEITSIEDYLILSFVKDYNLYSMISQDAGKTWLPPQQVNQYNNTVSAIRNHVALDNEYCVWTEHYFYNQTLALEKQQIKYPQFIIHNITGGLNLSLQISNIGTLAAVQTPYQIQIRYGWIFSDRKITGVLDLAPGETITLNTGPIIGIGKPSIVLTIDDTVTKTIPGVLLFYYLFI
jgi:hypothetical protein